MKMEDGRLADDDEECENGELCFKKARAAFAEELHKGEGKDMARLALHIAAAYDAVNSSCSVALPVNEYMKRINVLARGFHPPTPGQQSGDDDDKQSHAEEVEMALDLFMAQHRFRAVREMEHAEDPRASLLNEVLIRRFGAPSILYIIRCTLLHIAQQREPWQEHMGGEAPEPRRPVVEVRARGAQLTAMEEWALVDLLRRLKRAHWPFLWPKEQVSSEGGFLAACESELSPPHEHWNKSRRKNIRRAVLATEMLLEVCTAAQGNSVAKAGIATESRDMAALLAHCGLYADALDYLNRWQAKVDEEGGGADLSPTAEELAAADSLRSRLQLRMLENALKL